MVRGIGTIGRRQLLQSLGAGATTALGVLALPRAAHALGAGAEQATGNKAFAVTTVNHLSYPAIDYRKTRDFYVDVFNMRAVWDDGVRCQVDCGPPSAPNSLYIRALEEPGQKPTIVHFAFGLPNFWERSAELKAELLRRKFSGVRADGEGGYFVDGPSGFVVQPVTVMDPAMFPGAAQPCAVAKSAKCQAAFASGRANLGSIPKASGRGFTAQYFKYIVLHVPDVMKERNFYTSLFGMTVVAEKQDDVSLRFGENTLVLRPTAGGGAPYCNEFGLVVQNFDQAKVTAELQRRGISSRPNPFGGLAFTDPNGLEIGIGGPA